MDQQSAVNALNQPWWAKNPPLELAGQGIQQIVKALGGAPGMLHNAAVGAGAYRDPNRSIGQTLYDAANTAMMGAPMEAGSKPGPIRIYRGQSAHNSGLGSGKFYTPDREWARNFTQSGQDHEIIERSIHSNHVYDPPKPVYADDPDSVDVAIAEARKGGYKAVRLDEGQGQPQSLFVFDKTGLKSALPLE